MGLEERIDDDQTLGLATVRRSETSSPLDNHPFVFFFFFVFDSMVVHCSRRSLARYHVEPHRRTRHPTSFCARFCPAGGRFFVPCCSRALCGSDFSIAGWSGWSGWSGRSGRSGWTLCFLLRSVAVSKKTLALPPWHSHSSSYYFSLSFLLFSVR